MVRVGGQEIKTPGHRFRQVILSGLVLSYLAVTVAAVYRPALPGLKGYFGLLTALSAYRGILLHVRSGPSDIRTSF